MTRLSDKDKYSNEALALHKLIMPLGKNGTEEKTIISDLPPLKFPDKQSIQDKKKRGNISDKGHCTKS